MQELPADATVVGQRGGQVGDVPTGDLADLRHCVDKRDLGCEERVRGELYQFSSGIVGNDNRHTCVDEGGVDAAQDRLGNPCPGRVGWQTEDQAVGPQGVVNSEAFAQELRVPRQLHGGGLGVELSRQSHGRADGHGGFSDDERPRPDPSSEQPGEGGVNMAHVGRIRPGKLWSPYTDEVDVRGSGGVRHGRGETQAVSLQVLAQELLQPWFEERRLAGGETSDPDRVHIDADHVESQFRHADRMGRAQVAGTDDAQTKIARDRHLRTPAPFLHPRPSCRSFLYPVFGRREREPALHCVASRPSIIRAEDSQQAIVER